MNGKNRQDVYAGLTVDIVLKKGSANREDDARDCEGFADE